jgi:Domain of unknown function (DUF4926)
MKIPNAERACDLGEVMNEQIKQLDVVALTEDLPEYGLYRGQVGTVVERYTPDTFEVEFTDVHGRTYAMTSVSAKQLMLLHYAPLEKSL